MSGNLNRLDPAVFAAWPTPNYVDPVRKSYMPVYAGVLQGASSLIVLTRLYLRARNQAGPFGLDDVCVCILDPLILPPSKALTYTHRPYSFLDGWRR